MIGRIFMLSVIFLMASPMMAQQRLNCQESPLLKKLNLQQILDRHAEAMGGKQAWRKLRSYELHQAGRNGSQIISYAEKPDKMRYDFVSQGNTQKILPIPGFITKRLFRISVR